MKKKISNITVKKFTQSQRTKVKKLHSFIERGVVVNILHKKGKMTENTADGYTFGYKDAENNYWWFFNGKIVTMDRKEAIKVFKQLVEICNQHTLGVPFINKKKKFFK